jgi:uncharacterized membrane protein
LREQQEGLQVTQEKESVPQKTRIESLSDLIFGLALSIGALTLIGQPPSDFQGLLLAIAFYGFTFIILISVWYSYTKTMAHLHVETDKLVILNIVLLFLVSIEPFLFNQLINSSMPLVENASIVYALDLAGLFAVQAFLANAILADKNQPPQLLHSFNHRRNTLVISTALFLISTLPVFWTWAIQINSGFGIPLRFILWITTLFMPSIRRFWENRERKQKNSN